MKIRLFIVLCVLYAFPLFAKEKTVLPVKLSGFPEKATFDIYKQGSRFGAYSYTLSKDGHYQRQMSIFYGGQKITYKLKITPDTHAIFPSTCKTPTTVIVAATKKDHHPTMLLLVISINEFIIR